MSGKRPQSTVLIDNPYSPPEWPQLDPSAGSDLIEILSALLTPISDFRSTIPQSTGKRKRRHEKQAQKKEQNAVTAEEASEKPADPKPTSPGILKYVTIGVNATTSGLETAVSPPPEPRKTTEASVVDPDTMEIDSKTTSAPQPLRAVFVCRADGHPTQLHAHLPTLCQLAKPPAKLLALPKGAEARLAKACGVQRLGVFGVRDGAPGADLLWECIEALPTVEVPWVKEKGEFQNPAVKQVLSNNHNKPVNVAKEKRKAKRLLKKQQKAQEMKEKKMNSGN